MYQIAMEGCKICDTTYGAVARNCTLIWACRALQIWKSLADGTDVTLFGCKCGNKQPLCMLSSFTSLITQKIPNTDKKKQMYGCFNDKVFCVSPGNAERNPALWKTGHKHTKIWVPMEIIDWTISFLVGDVLSIFVLVILKYTKQNGESSQNSEKWKACFQLAETQKPSWELLQENQSVSSDLCLV